jgi:hypothetical protein
MNTLPQFTSFIEELQALIDKYHPSNAVTLAISKPARQRHAAARDLPRYREQFALIVDYVANMFELDPGTIDQTKGRCRYARIAWARQIAMVLCHELTGAGVNTVAQHFNQRDHGAVCWAKGRVAERCKDSPDEAALLATLRHDVKACLELAASMKHFKKSGWTAPSPQFGPNDRHHANPIVEFVTNRTRTRAKTTTNGRASVPTRPNFQEP